VAELQARGANADDGLLIAAFHWHAECLVQLLRSRRNLPPAQAAKDSALQNAAYMGHAQCVRLLVRAGAYPSSADDRRLHGPDAGDPPR
jgi:ankyrin repeat protein